MNIETYQDGILIGIRPVENSQLLPNFTLFNNLMINSNDYALIAYNSTDQVSKTRLEIASVRLELKTEYTNQDWEDFKILWDLTVLNLSQNFKATIHIENLNNIAIQANMPFRFNGDLSLQLLQ